MQYCAADIVEQNLSRLLTRVHKMEFFDLFGHLKRNECEV